MRKKFIQLAVILLSSLIFSAQAKTRDLVVCAVPQTYSAIEQIKRVSPVKFDTFYAMPDEILSRINNRSGICSIVISADERLALLLLRSNQTSNGMIKQLVKAPLILWSADESLFKDNIDAITKQKLKSIGLPNPHLTPVGFSSKQVVERKSFPTKYLKHKIFRADHEFQIYSFVRSQNVQSGFITKPLVMKNGLPQGSYWKIPENYYQAIIYFIVNTSKRNTNANNILFNYLYSDKEALNFFYQTGFEPL